MKLKPQHKTLRKEDSSTNLEFSCSYSGVSLFCEFCAARWFEFRSLTPGVWDSRYATHDIARRKIQALLADKNSARVAGQLSSLMVNPPMVNPSGFTHSLDPLR